jgi:HD superfamily phosphodiesterase
MTEKVLHKMIEYFGNDVRRINHALKVYAFANTISRNEKLADKEIEITEFAAILHDIGIPESERKYNSSNGKYQEIEGPPIARSILENLGAKPEIVDRVCYLIGNHHSYSKIDGPDFQILVEADFLVNIFEDEINKESVKSIRDKYFKTYTALAILDRIY